MSLFVLGIVLFSCLCSIPFGFPGTWLMVLSAFLYGPLTGTPIGMGTLIGVSVLALLSEGLDLLLGAKLAQRFGGSSRAAWGSILGGLAGGVLGIPLPIVGSISGAFLGAFLGAWIGERSLGRTTEASTWAATGALIGRLVAVAAKTAIASAMMVWILASAVWGAPGAPWST